MKISIKKGYADARKAAYPSYAEQFDILFHQGYDAWKATIQDVKNKHPKTAD
jgi:hypothetical protein